MKATLIIIVISFIAGAVSSFVVYQKMFPPKVVEKVVIQKVEIMKQNIINRNVKDDETICMTDRFHYDHDPMTTKYSIVDKTNVKIDWVLYQRKGSQVVDLGYECGSSGSWKWYAGIGVAGIILGGYAIYKIKK
jgi:hypothetical protein